MIVSSRVIAHNRSDPEDCVTAYDIDVDESEYRKHRTHKPEVERRWAGSVANGELFLRQCLININSARVCIMAHVSEAHLLLLLLSIKLLWSQQLAESCGENPIGTNF